MMKLKASEMFTMLLLTATVIFAAVKSNEPAALVEEGIIEKRRLKEDSTVILIDMPPATADDIFQYSFENK